MADDAMLRDAALQLRDALEELGLPSWVKTSGSKGFHIAVPLHGKLETDQVAGFAHAVGTLLVTRDPKHPLLPRLLPGAPAFGGRW